MPLEEETMLILAGMLGGAEGEDVPLYHGESLHKKYIVFWRVGVVGVLHWIIHQPQEEAVPMQGGEEGKVMPW